MFNGSRYFVLVWTLVLTSKPPDDHKDTYYIGPALVTVLDIFRSSFTGFFTFASTRRSRGNKKCPFKVNFSIHLMNATFMAVFLIFLAGDISKNPGPILVDSPEEVPLGNISVVISNRHNYSRFKQPSKLNATARTHNKRIYPNGNLIYIPCQTPQSPNRSSQNRMIRGQSHCLKISHLNARSSC